MNSFKDSVAFWTSILGTVLGCVGVFQSVNWLAAIGGILAVASVCAIAYATFQRQRIESAVLKVAGRSIDSLNMAGLRRRVNKTLVIQEARNTATIDQEDLAITWQCAGYGRSDLASNIEFSIDSDNNIPWTELECFAHDLKHDPGRRHRIRPILVGPDGISKKIAVPFLHPIRSGEPFNVFLTCELSGCMKRGMDYYTSTLSFEQDDVLLYSLRLIFLHDGPNWLRAYETDALGSARLWKELRPGRVRADRVEYFDEERNRSPRSSRIYVFSRSGAFSDRDHDEHFTAPSSASD